MPRLGGKGGVLAVCGVADGVGCSGIGERWWLWGGGGVWKVRLFPPSAAGAGGACSSVAGKDHAVLMLSIIDESLEISPCSAVREAVD